ncbi:MAG: hypothetical protein ACLRMZ_16410 [Blautia marasmi]
MVKTAGKRVKIYQWTENGLDIQVTKKPFAICICVWGRTEVSGFPHLLKCRSAISEDLSGREWIG